MVDGEDRSVLRPLRPAAPPDGPATRSSAAAEAPASRLPRPRRPWSRSTTDSPAAPPAAPSSGDVPTKDATPAESATPATDAAPAESATPAKDATPGPAATTTDEVTSAPTPAGRRRRVPLAHAVRLPTPRQAAARATRATRDWSRRPSGRLTLPGVFLLVLVAGTATAGALVVPAAAPPRPAAVDSSADPSTGPTDLVPAAPGATPPPTATLPPGAALPTVPGTAPVGGRPSDALADWARQVGPKVGIAPVAMQAYGYAELVLAETDRSCGLSWTTLAAIGFVESGHGQANNASLGADGRALPEIIGLPLDGQGNRMRIADTDGGRLDRDTTYDRAVGPMQFIPTTWQEIGADADNDGVKDPHNIHDAALAAGNYLCKGGRNLTIPGDWWNAILSYNAVRRYAQEVFDTANRYGQASRT
ncbi:lytic transglycosylase domain-containing protein [Micromonospora nigra]|uniref:lytic transglycosylase domain-containing protein n=1 Tax=Micromonospora nigra TaxID=145857 RepID=UPI000B8089C5|nr:lytic transglycosylase domain-containing protein [Micromonospora nigra]